MTTTATKSSQPDVKGIAIRKAQKARPQLVAAAAAAVTRSPVVVAYGMGVDSTAMLVGMQQRGERPDLILWADTGDEKAATYAYLPIIQAWLAKVGFPQVTVVKNLRPKSGDKSLSESLIRLGTLPALAYRQHQCSIVWKIVPQHAFLKEWEVAQDAWLAGFDVITCVGYDNGDRDSCRRYGAEGKAPEGFENRYPLVEWKWDRAECERQIAAAGLPVPVKSACFHCPAMKKPEIEALRADEPKLFERALLIERTAIQSGNLKTAKGLGINWSWNAAYGQAA